ncbi:MAG: acylphosphatase [Cyanobacteria bacterium P01_F01_bin.33]
MSDRELSTEAREFDLTSATAPLQRVRAIVSGKVQGVGYRFHTQQMARSLDVAGWVRNLPDGRVEAVFEASAVLVERAVQWCHRGSPAARVRAVEVVSEPPEGLQGFEICY